jgi:glycerol-3-phosphate dehydrogenase subunit C
MSKLNPLPPRPPALDPNDERFWDPRDLEAEMRRMLDVCHNCRMCVGYCGTFPDVFARVDRDVEKRGAQGAELLGAADFASATDLCWQCKLCYVKCPYTKDEGHAWLLDIPRLLMREKAQRARRNGVTLQDKVLGEPQALGRMTAGPLAPIANFVNANRLVRKAAEVTAGISSKFPLPTFATQTFAGWLEHHTALPGAGSRGTVALFATCLGDYNFPRIAATATRVLEKNGWAVLRPEQTCCGMPNLDGGDVESAKGKAAANVASLLPHVEKGHKIVSLQPTCGYMVKKEWPDLLGTEDAKRVAAATVDVMELLEQQRRDKSLSREYTRGAGKVAYHAACHLRAQKIGFPAVRLMSTLPDTEVEVIEQCSAVDGTWGMKAQYYEMGRRYAQKLTRGVENAGAQTVATDCALAARRILAENRVAARHPVEILAEAYGVAPEMP